MGNFVQNPLYIVQPLYSSNASGEDPTRNLVSSCPHKQAASRTFHEEYVAYIAGSRQLFDISDLLLLGLDLGIDLHGS